MLADALNCTRTRDIATYRHTPLNAIWRAGVAIRLAFHPKPALQG